MGKTVYILGAGFSKPGGFPLQGELFARLSDKIVNPDFSLEEFLPFEITSSIAQFLKKAGFMEEGAIAAKITLEDLFTLLDQTIAERGNFIVFSWHKLISIRDNLIRGVLGLLHGCAHEYLSSEDNRYKLFAGKLIETRMQAGQSGDPFSIIALNWDSLLEDSVFRVLRETGGIRDNKSLADIDYCIYTTPLPGSVHKPSITQKASGIYNIKLLKLHGSSTWLRCPCSNHIYTGLGMDAPAYDIYVKPRVSPFIEQHLDEREKDSPSVLEPYIITPTFAKVFDSPHIQTTWQNAFVELREADEVVFIGYSIPEADYHFRTLLRRAIRSTTPVRVILHKSDEPAADSQNTDPRTMYPAQRYCQVFREEQLTFDYDGIEGFVSTFAPDEQQALMERLTNSFDSLAGNANQ